MSVSKPKRASFRIDDILEIKTNSTEEISDRDDQKSTENNNNTKDVKSKLIDVAKTTATVYSSIGFQLDHIKSHSSLLQEIGNRKRKRDDYERSIAEIASENNRLCDVEKRVSSDDDESPAQKQFDFKADHRPLQYSNSDKFFPIVPRATKLPTSLESLMKTQQHDYLLKFPAAALSPWGLLANHCLTSLPPAFGLPLSAHDKKSCLCGAPNCAKHRPREQRLGTNSKFVFKMLTAEN